MSCLLHHVLEMGSCNYLCIDQSNLMLYRQDLFCEWLLTYKVRRSVSHRYDWSYSSVKYCCKIRWLNTDVVWKTFLRVNNHIECHMQFDMVVYRLKRFSNHVSIESPNFATSFLVKVFAYNRDSVMITPVTLWSVSLQKVWGRAKPHVDRGL